MRRSNGSKMIFNPIQRVKLFHTSKTKGRNSIKRYTVFGTLLISVFLGTQHEKS
jgi:hypothetical protein